jgi:hypothetical protein
MMTMDFVEGLPKSGAANCILVVVDKFTKYGHFIPLHHPYTVVTVAKACLDNVYKLHGMPLSIVSDRDRIFTSRFWQELFRRAQVQLRMSSSYHPQSDGQTECVNQCMETYLWCFVHACPTKWLQYLPLAEFWYNTSLHFAIGRSPFEALYGHSSRIFGITATNSTPVDNLDQWLQERSVVQDLTRQHLSRAQLRMKYQANNGRTEREF